MYMLYLNVTRKDVAPPIRAKAEAIIKSMHSRASFAPNLKSENKSKLDAELINR